MRRDAVDRQRATTDKLVRFVVAPDGRVMPDLGLKLPGRGVWLKALPGRIEAAAKRGVFARAAKRSVMVEPDLGERVVALLRERMLETASLARRAGQIVTGFEQVEAELKTGRQGLLLIAEDAGIEAKRLIAKCDGRRYIAAFDRVALGRRLGRGETVYAFIGAGALADRMMADARRLAGFGRIEMTLDDPDGGISPANGKVSQA